MPAAPPPVPDRRPLQFAFATCGTELSRHMAQHLYEIGEALHAHDGVNTFNVIDRTAAGQSLASCPVTQDLLPAYRLKYGRHRRLLRKGGGGALTADGRPVLSCKGPQQGDTWGSMVCAVATHRSLTLAQLRSPTTTFLGLADDVLDSDDDPLVGHHALAFFQHFIDERLGVKSNADKGGVLARPDVDLSMIPAHVPGSPACPRLGEAARLGCLKHLGGFVGADAAVSQHVASTTIKRLRNLGSLRFVRDTERVRWAAAARLRLLRHCASGAIGDLLRMHPPSTTAAACAHHRDAVTTALDHILACPFATAEEGAFAINLAALAPALGGLGLTLAAREAGGCYSASAIFALSSARSLHPAFATLDLTTHEAPSVAALRAAHSAILVAHRRVTAAYDAFDSAAPTVDRTGAESTSFRLAGLPELVLSAAHLPPPEDSDADANTAPRRRLHPPRRPRPPPPC